MKRRGQLHGAPRRSKSDRGSRKCKGPEVGTGMSIWGNVGRLLRKMGIIMLAPKVVEMISKMTYAKHFAWWPAPSRGAINIAPFSLS